MASRTERLMKKQLASPPPWIENNIHYEVIMGSVAYGVSNDTSDMDIYGFCIPPKHVIFPHLAGVIYGFGNQGERFEQYQQHHIKDVDKEYDISIYNIVKYFQLVMKNNPNMIDSLFVPQRCVLHCTQVGNHVRENRKLFLHKGAWQAFKGYAFSQVHKMKTKLFDASPKRKAEVDKYGYSLKFAYHVVRLMNEVEQILIEGDLDLERNREQLKSIRRGEWAQEQIVEYFETKERDLESVYSNSKLQYSPNEQKIKSLLLECLEMHYGSLEKAINKNKNVEMLIDELQNIIKKYS